MTESIIKTPKQLSAEWGVERTVKALRLLSEVVVIEESMLDCAKKLRTLGNENPDVILLFISYLTHDWPETEGARE